ncbi:MAG: hypothetical protein A3J28_06750 [Acidobacteria bacterium RIFCSPLOWO2_12_FULL_60_22]|nr:MAG: hypothetical protein A3J28_06750 [Acidobacteria bacterium RIFCSPLOWO2_12_FULL_60_22]
MVRQQSVIRVYNRAVCRGVVMIEIIYRWTRSVAFAVCVVAAAAWAVQLEIQPAPAQPSFAKLVGEFSEPSGEFDTDNLISNEKSYLHVVPRLEQRGVTGGVYIGVGPDQNFSYIARIRPTVAFIVDIRRDNLLLHLLFKALFAASRNRAEYLSLLTGRPVPDRVESWRDAGIEEIVAYLDGAGPAATLALDRRLHDAIQRFGVPVSAKEWATIDRFHAAFVDSGLSLRFRSFGRPPQSYYPDYRELLLETDRKGRQRSYLASEDDFQFVRALQGRDGVIPVVGDLGGTHALAAIGHWMAERKEPLSAFYVSNVENYLFRDGGFGRYMENLNRLPHTDRSVMIRSVFGRFALPESAPGYYSSSAVQDFNELLANFSAGKYRTYADLLRK